MKNQSEAKIILENHHEKLSENSTFINNQMNSSLLKKPKEKIENKSKESENSLDISSLRKYLTFTELSNGISTIKNASVLLFGQLANNSGPNFSNYLLICLGILFLVTAIAFCLFKSKFVFKGKSLFLLVVKETNKLQSFLKEKINGFSSNSGKKNENTITLKGRTIRRPANQYHYILENKSNNEDDSVLSDELQEEM